MPQRLQRDRADTTSYRVTLSAVNIRTVAGHDNYIMENRSIRVRRNTPTTHIAALCTYSTESTHLAKKEMPDLSIEAPFSHPIFVAASSSAVALFHHARRGGHSSRGEVNHTSTTPNHIHTIPPTPKHHDFYKTFRRTEMPKMKILGSQIQIDRTSSSLA